MNTKIFAVLQNRHDNNPYWRIQMCARHASEAIADNTHSVTEWFERSNDTPNEDYCATCKREMEREA